LVFYPLVDRGLPLVDLWYKKNLSLLVRKNQSFGFCVPLAKTQ
jgi:hypothetical protein